MKQLLFIFNPHSGTGEICKHLANVLDTFTKAGYDPRASAQTRRSRHR